MSYKNVQTKDDMNALTIEKKTLAVSMLCEGSSIRAIERVTGIHRDTIMRLGVRMGEACKKIMDEKMDLLDKLDRLVRNEADGKEIEAVFPQIQALDVRIVSEREKFFNTLPDLLTIEQRARFLLFERQFERELREAMKEVRRQRLREGEE